jgi:hypothetical protein
MVNQQFKQFWLFFPWLEDFFWRLLPKNFEFVSVAYLGPASRLNLGCILKALRARDSCPSCGIDRQKNNSQQLGVLRTSRGIVVTAGATDNETLVSLG